LANRTLRLNHQSLTNVHRALTRRVMLSNTEQYRKYLLRRAQAGTAVFAFDLRVFPFVKCSEMPYYVMEIPSSSQE